MSLACCCCRRWWWWCDCHRYCYYFCWCHFFLLTVVIVKMVIAIVVLTVVAQCFWRSKYNHTQNPHITRWRANFSWLRIITWPDRLWRWNENTTPWNPNCTSFLTCNKVSSVDWQLPKFVFVGFLCVSGWTTCALLSVGAASIPDPTGTSRTKAFWVISSGLRAGLDLFSLWVLNFECCYSCCCFPCSYYRGVTHQLNHCCRLHWCFVCHSF